MQFSRLATLALISIPYLGVGALIRYCQKKEGISLEDEMEFTPLTRKAMLVHFGYFVVCPILIEAFPDAPGVPQLIGTMPVGSSNVLFMMICLAAENFFVTSTSLGMLLLTKKSVPRWAMMTPIAQLAWNLKNHVAWFFLSGTFAPEGPLYFALVDMSVIWPITGIYAYNFLNGKKMEKKE